jgi:16S rRNA processing protein RimM
MGRGSEPAPRLRVGRVLRALGLDGSVRVESLSDFPDRFRSGASVRIGDRELTVEAVRGQGEELVIRFAGITDRLAAERLEGEYLTVPLEEARALPADHFYHFQLVGLTVIDARTGQPMGVVAEVLPNPANDILRVVNGPLEVLVPLVRAVVKAVNPGERTMLVDLPPAEEA